MKCRGVNVFSLPALTCQQLTYPGCTQLLPSVSVDGSQSLTNLHKIGIMDHLDRVTIL